MDTEIMDKIRHAHSLINGLHHAEDGFYEAIDEATETLQSLLPDDNNWAGHTPEHPDTPTQILRLVTGG